MSVNDAGMELVIKYRYDFQLLSHTRTQEMYNALVTEKCTQVQCHLNEKRKVLGFQATKKQMKKIPISR